MGEVLNIWRWGISRTTGLPSLATHQARMGMETIKEAGAYQYQGPLHRLCLVVLCIPKTGNQLCKSGN